MDWFIFKYHIIRKRNYKYKMDLESLLIAGTNMALNVIICRCDFGKSRHIIEWKWLLHRFYQNIQFILIYVNEDQTLLKISMMKRQYLEFKFFHIIVIFTSIVSSAGDVIFKSITSECNTMCVSYACRSF